MTATDDALTLIARWAEVRAEVQRPNRDDDDETERRLWRAEDDIEAQILALPPGAPNAAAARGLVLADRAALAMDSLGAGDTLLKSVIGAFAGGVLA